MAYRMYPEKIKYIHVNAKQSEKVVYFKDQEMWLNCFMLNIV